MKKKEYIAPAVELVECDDMVLLAGSGVTSTDPAVGWGGIDDDGSKDPD